MNSLLSSINPKIGEVDEPVKSITFKEPVINDIVRRSVTNQIKNDFIEREGMNFKTTNTPKHTTT